MIVSFLARTATRENSKQSSLPRPLLPCLFAPQAHTNIYKKRRKAGPNDRKPRAQVESAGSSSLLALLLLTWSFRRRHQSQRNAAPPPSSSRVRTASRPPRPGSRAPHPHSPGTRHSALAACLSLVLGIPARILQAESLNTATRAGRRRSPHGESINVLHFVELSHFLSVFPNLAVRWWWPELLLRWRW
jgi:hypothetical protein